MKGGKKKNISRLSQERCRVKSFYSGVDAEQIEAHFILPFQAKGERSYSKD